MHNSIKTSPASNTCTKTYQSEHEKIPDSCKIVRVIPIHKGGSKTQLQAHFCPIDCIKDI